jgi:LysM repeat protein
VKMLKKQFIRNPKKKLHAAAQRSAPKYAEDECGSDEPNVKLSRAFVVVLLLHVVAVGGIFAFSALKDRQMTPTKTAKSSAQETTPSFAGTTQPVSNDQALAAHKIKTADTTTKPLPLDVQKLIDSPRVTSAKSQTNVTQETVPDGAKTYVVQRGDNPAGIAKKFKVNYTELLKANGIDDPRKLQIGQRLTIPK